MDSKTTRVLNLDGGGARGYLSIKFLQKFCDESNIPSDELWQYFDCVSGVSIGAINAVGIADGIPLETIELIYLEKAKRIFSTNGVDSNRPSNLTKVIDLVQSTAFYESPNETSNYGHNILHSTLVELFGDRTLSSLKTKVIIPAFRKIAKKYVMFSNYDHPNFIGKDAKIVDVLRATSAAPFYLPKYVFDGYTYIDGGIYRNNVTDISLDLGMLVKPLAKRYCVLSVGTGIGEYGFHDSEVIEDQEQNAISEIVKLLNISMTGSQESVDFSLKLRSYAPLYNFYYYRFNPVLDSNINTELDNTDPSFFSYLNSSVDTHYASESQKITNFIGHFLA